MNKDVVGASAGVITVLGTGGALTTIGPWYAALKKPSWQPPGWLFGPAWTLIGVLTTIAAVRSWRHAKAPGERNRVLALFACNGVFNVLWSLLFFNRRRPDLALGEIVPLWGSIAALILGLPRKPGTSVASSSITWLLLPYLGWVSFAAVLNYEVVRLNAPFEKGSGSD